MRVCTGSSALLVSLLACCHAGDITYTYTTDADLVPTKKSEIHGLNSGDIVMFGGGMYNMAVGDVASDTVVMYHEEYFFVEGGTSSTVWSETAVLTAIETTGGAAVSNGLGFAIDAYDDILMATAPTGNGNSGGVFVYHDNIADQWTQLQNLQPLEKKTANGNFGYDVALNNNGTLAIIGEPDNAYISTSSGAAYIFGASNHDTRTFWTQLQELYPDNGAANSYFGAQVEMFGKYAAVTSPGSCEVYLFEEETPKPKPCPDSSKHSHANSALHRKLHENIISLSSLKPRITGDRFLHWSLKQKLHAVDCSTGKDSMEVAFDEGRLVVTDKNYATDQGRVYIYEIVYRSLASCLASMPRATSLVETTSSDDTSCGTSHHDCRSEQFDLRSTLTGTTGQYLGSSVDLNGDIMVVSSAESGGTMYVYQRADSQNWNIVQTIANPSNPAVTQFGVYNVGISGNNEIMAAALTGNGGTGTTNFYTYNLDSSWYCVVIAMYDLFGDGWNGAQLKVTSSTGTYYNYYPRNAYRRNQNENPTYVRYCPDDWEASSTETFIDIEIPHALDFPYHWEIKWKVYFENVQRWLIVGDHATKARVRFLKQLQILEYSSVQHPYNDTRKCSDNCVTWDSTDAPSKSPPTKAKAIHGIGMNERPIHTLREYEDRALDDTSKEVTEGIERKNILPSERDLVPSVASIPSPKRHLAHLRTATPSISPAPTFAQTPLTHAYPWVTLQDSGSTGWFKGEDTGTQWFLSSADGMRLLGTGTLCDSTDKVCKLPLPDGVYPSNEDYVLRVTGDLDSRSGSFSYFFCGKTGSAPSHMDFTIDIYNEYLDGRCIGNNYFTKADYVSATLDLDVVMKGVLVLGGFTALTELTDVDYDILASALRSTVHGDESVEISFSTYDYYDVKKLGFEMLIPTSTYNLDPRVHGSANTTFSIAQRYLRQASSLHSMGAVIANGAGASALAGVTSSFTNLLYVEVTEITFVDFLTKQHVTYEERSRVSPDATDRGSGSSNSGGDGYEGDPVSFVTDGEEESPSLSKSLLSYANLKMGAAAFFALSLVVYFVSNHKNRRVLVGTVEDNSSSLLDVSTTRLLREKKHSSSSKKKKKKSHVAYETDELLSDADGNDNNDSVAFDLEDGKAYYEKEKRQSGPKKSKSNKGDSKKKIKKAMKS